MNEIDVKSLVLGIELGSTRVKSALIDKSGRVLAHGAYGWENTLVDGYWSYSLDEVKTALRASFSLLKSDFEARHGVKLTRLGAIGISAMCHGYLAFDENMNQLVPFRTWRNVKCREASEILTRRLNYPMPQRWSATHYFQCILNGEAQVKRVSRLFTLASYVHFLLTSENNIGISDASGMFPVDGADYDFNRINDFNGLIKEHGLTVDFKALLPKIVPAGSIAGYLTSEGALLLDESGELQGGIPLCPPEGDGGTGMVCTNTVTAGAGNLSVGTSCFGCFAVEALPERLEKGVEVLFTPTGIPTLELHCNNFSPELNFWCGLFAEASSLAGNNISAAEAASLLTRAAVGGNTDNNRIVPFNIASGEDAIGVQEGRPLLLRAPDSAPNLADFYRALVFSSFAPISVGLKRLRSQGIRLNKLMCHGGFFKSGEASRILAATALGSEVTVLEEAEEGGAYGVALLALFMLSGCHSLPDFLNGILDVGKSETTAPNPAFTAEYARFLQRYQDAIPLENEAAKYI